MDSKSFNELSLCWRCVCSVSKMIMRRKQLDSDIPLFSVNLESTLNNYILPQVDNDSERAERLVNVVGTFGEKQKLAFTALVRKQKLFIENMHTYVNMCENAVSFGTLNTVIC